MSSPFIKITIAQLRISKDGMQNKQKIISVLGAAEPDDWVIFPEGALSGYFPQDGDFLKDIRPGWIEESIREIGQLVQEKRCHCLLGTATFSNNVWHNSVIFHSYLIPLDTQRVYHKIQLSAVDKSHFSPGYDISTFSVGGVTIGVQVCRELVFPEPWLALKQTGVQIVFHINNAIKPYDEIWEHLLITRAVENRFFVCSVNNAAPPQKLRSYLISPRGQMLIKTEEQQEQIVSHLIDLSEANSPLPKREKFQIVEVEIES